MDAVEVPEYFICPISLQIMKDPVTAITGITYDRESIENWLLKPNNNTTSTCTTCPATKQPLPRDSDLTPNHTLRRLIQSWCAQNASNGVDPMPTPKPILTKFDLLNLIRDFRLPNLQLKTLRKLEALALDQSDRNRRCMVEAGVPKAIVSFVVACFKRGQTSGLQEALSILCLMRHQSSSSHAKQIVVENDDIIESLRWVLGLDGIDDSPQTLKTHVLLVLKAMVSKASSIVLQRLRPELFQTMVHVLKEGVSQQGINAALHVMLEACLWGRNRLMMVEAGAVSQLIELELASPEKRTTELVLGVLLHLCSCADGRAELLRHAGGVAVVTKRLLRVSPAADDRAILILSLICKFSGTAMVLKEMMEVGTVTRLCMLLQVDCASSLKDRAKDILRAHSDVWKASPCIEHPLLTR